MPERTENFPLSAHSWSRGSTPFTALNVGRRGWRSCPCPMLRLLLWGVRTLCVPFIHWPDKWVNICVLATHIEFSLYSPLMTEAHLWNRPLTVENLLVCVMSASRWQQREWERLGWQVQRWVWYAAPSYGSEFFLLVSQSCFSQSLCNSLPSFWM